MAKGGGSQTSTQSNDPWAGQQPYLTTGFAEAQKNYQAGGPAYYEGNTVAAPGNTTQQAQALQIQRATNGNPMANAAQTNLTNTINGDYLNGNPMLAANFQAGAGEITKAYQNATAGVDSNANAGGRLGSGMQAFYRNQEADTLAKNLGNLYTNTYYNNYNTERGNQMNAASMAPSFAANDYQDLNALSDVGTAQDTYSQNLVNADIDRYNYNQNLPNNNLANYMNLIQGNYGGTSTSTQKAGGGSGFGQMLGTGLSIASLFSDRRLKEDITPVGKADNGLTIYRYRYKGLPQFHLGFMADEVKDIHPEAVHTDASGFDMVNYALAV